MAPTPSPDASVTLVGPRRSGDGSLEYLVRYAPGQAAVPVPAGLANHLWPDQCLALLQAAAVTALPPGPVKAPPEEDRKPPTKEEPEQPEGEAPTQPTKRLGALTEAGPPKKKPQRAFGGPSSHAPVAETRAREATAEPGQAEDAESPAKPRRRCSAKPPGAYYYGGESDEDEGDSDYEGSADWDLDDSDASLSQPDKEKEGPEEGPDEELGEQPDEELKEAGGEAVAGPEGPEEGPDKEPKLYSSYPDMMRTVVGECQGPGKCFGLLLATIEDRIRRRFDLPQDDYSMDATRLSVHKLVAREELRLAPGGCMPQGPFHAGPALAQPKPPRAQPSKPRETEVDFAPVVVELLKRYPAGLTRSALRQGITKHYESQELEESGLWQRLKRFLKRSLKAKRILLAELGDGLDGPFLLGPRPMPPPRCSARLIRQAMRALDGPVGFTARQLEGRLEEGKELTRWGKARVCKTLKDDHAKGLLRLLPGAQGPAGPYRLV